MAAANDVPRPSDPAQMWIIVVNYGSSELIAANIRPELRAQAQILIVDNLSTADEADRLRDLATERGWHLLPLPDNRGFGAACNEGARFATAAGATSLLFLNPDASVDESVVNSLRQHLADHGEELVSPRIVDSEGRRYFDGAWLDLARGRTHGGAAQSAGERPWLTGTCLAVTARDFSMLGGFAEDYFLYWEDVDLSVRALDLGLALVVREDLVAVHDEGGTQDRMDRRSKSNIYYRYMCRNRLVFAAKHCSRRVAVSWLLRSPWQSYRILLHGGRRQLLTRPAVLWAALRGTVAGAGILVASLLRPKSSFREPDAAKPTAVGGIVRSYEVVRTAHLERAHEWAPAGLLYGRQRYDFDQALTQGLDLVRCGLGGLIRELVRRRPAVLEVNEPLQRSGLLRALVGVATVRALGLLTGRRCRVVAYAIENRDPFTDPAPTAKSRLRRTAERRFASVLSRQLDVVVFGTDGSRDLHHRLVGRQLRRADQSVVQAVPAACSCPAPERRGPTVLFVGAFEERKGIRQLLQSWASISRQCPEAELKLIGKGALLAEVTEFAASQERVTLTVDPPRTQIHAALRSARVLVLMSQPTDTWREQVGLPIVEGLAHGCRIVTTDQTGLAQWLATHDHQVLAPQAPADELTAAVLSGLRADQPAAVLNTLPAVDGRALADQVLMNGSGSEDFSKRSADGEQK